MKVKIEFTIDVDPEAWKMNFWPETNDEVRDDVKSRAKYLLQAQFEQDGVLATTSTATASAPAWIEED